MDRRSVRTSRGGMLAALGGYLIAVAFGVAVVDRSAPSALSGLLLGAAFVLAAGGVVVTFWRFSARAYVHQERYRRELFDAELGALARLREAGQIREDVIASVSHEFRTPLTAIRGSAATLLAHADQIGPADRAALLAGIVEHSDRLGRLLEDMLLAASATAATDSGTVADVTAAMSGFVLDQARPPVSREIEPGLAGYVDAVSLDRVVRALADHVGAEARRDRPVRLRARRQPGEIIIDVTYAASRPEKDLARLFEPFGSGDSARTGHPASLALYLARRLVEAHGGRVSAGHDWGSDRTRIRVVLRALRPHGPTDPRTAQPAAAPANGAEHEVAARASDASVAPV